MYTALSGAKFLNLKPPVVVGARMDDKPAKHQIFLLLGKNESCAAEGCMGSLAALKGRPYIYVALRQHMYYYL